MQIRREAAKLLDGLCFSSRRHRYVMFRAAYINSCSISI